MQLIAADQTHCDELAKHSNAASGSGAIQSSTRSWQRGLVTEPAVACEVAFLFLHCCMPFGDGSRTCHPLEEQAQPFHLGAGWN